MYLLFISSYRHTRYVWAESLIVQHLNLFNVRPVNETMDFLFVIVKTNVSAEYVNILCVCFRGSKQSSVSLEITMT